MYVYSATIGRNVPVTDPTLPQRDDVTGQRIQVPMSDEQWATFVEDVKADMASTYADLYLDEAERTFEDSTQDEEAIAVLGDAISGRKDWQNFPARKSKLLNTSKTNSKKWVLTSAQAWAVMA